ncbi:MAG: hypothetical protein ABII00_10440 [Elusimicrobiota bacterium]
MRKSVLKWSLGLVLVLAAPAANAGPEGVRHGAPAGDGLDFPSEIRLKAETDRYSHFEVSFPSARKSPFPVNDTVWGHLYLPRIPPWVSPPDGGRGLPPCVLVLPVMAAPNVWIEMRFVHAFLRRGLAVMWIEMPYQFHRRPHPSIPSGQVFLARTARRLGENFRQSIADARRSISWLRGSGLVDGGRIGLFGISLGAAVGAAAYSVDSRPRGAVFALGGADFPDLVFRSSMTGPFLKKSGIREEELREAWRGIDPMEYREENRGKPVVLVNARGDSVVPPENARRLKEAFPDARQLWVPWGHYSALLHLTWMPSYAARQFSRLLR